MVAVLKPRMLTQRQMRSQVAIRRLSNRGAECEKAVKLGKPPLLRPVEKAKSDRPIKRKTNQRNHGLKGHEN
jgi:hypothetical protein